MKFYVRKLNPHELGYRRGVPNKAGRYILISKKNSVSNFFPLLDENIEEPSVSVGIINNETKSLVFCDYVWHNGSRHRGKDKRLYLNHKIDINGTYYNKDDYLVFFKFKDDIDDRDLYTVYRFNSANKEYQKLEKLTEGKGHSVFQNLDFIDTTNIDYNEISISEKTKDRINGRLARNEKDVLYNQDEFKMFIRDIYDYKCAVTKTFINPNGKTNLQAAHIKPWSHKGNHSPNNGILLNRDLHWAFDRGCFTITDDLKIKVHEKMSDTYLKKFDNTEISKPKDNSYLPSLENIKYHQQNIFGSMRPITATS